jgi:hypothetical protein
VLEYLGLQVNRLIRVGYGPFNLGDLPRGQAVELTGKAVAHFLSEMTGTPIPRGGVKKADKVVIAAPAPAPAKAPRPPRPPARKGPSARPAPRKEVDAAARPPRKGAAESPPMRRGSDRAATASQKGSNRASPPAPRGAETLTNAPRKGPGSPTRARKPSRKHPPATRGNTPPRAPRK